MIRYAGVATAARLFSLSSHTRRAYRLLGNVVEGRRRIRTDLPDRYVERARSLLSQCDRHGAIRDGDRLLEVGTGWVHWEATVLALFYDVQITLFDVWDNRLWNVYKHYVARFDRHIETFVDMDPARRARAHCLVRALGEATCFDDVYRRLGFTYVIDPAGTLEGFAGDTFAVVLSYDVLEHIRREIIPQFARDVQRVLRPSGFSIHQVDLADHFAYFTSGVSRKNYYRYSDETWERYFESTVQFFNRVQRPEWLEVFGQAGLELIEQDAFYGNIGTMTIASRFAPLSRHDATCMVMRMMHRKPRE